MKNILFILMIPAILSSCNDLKKTIDDTLNTSNSAENSENINFKEKADSNSLAAGQNPSTQKSEDENLPFAAQKEKLELAEQQLRNLDQFRGKSVFIYKFIHFYADGRIITKLQNPENPDYVDEYTYDNGQWQTPKPVILSKKDDVNAELINLDKLPFKNANNVYQALVEKNNEIGSKSRDYTIYAGKRKNKVYWYPGSIQNDRYRYDIEYHEDGTLQSFEQR